MYVCEFQSSNNCCQINNTITSNLDKINPLLNFKFNLIFFYGNLRKLPGKKTLYVSLALIPKYIKNIKV